MKIVQLIVRNAQSPRPYQVVVAASLAFTVLANPVNAQSVASNVAGDLTNESTGETYQSTLDQLDITIEAKRQQVEKNPDSWLNREWLANAYLDRARLTGQFEHYAQADTTMQQAALVSESPRNSALSRAALNYTLHRLNEVEIDLQRAETALLVNAPTQRKIDVLRADVALQKGRYSEALASFKKLDKQAPDTESAFRLANYYWQMNDETSYKQWMTTAIDRVMGKAPRVRAWLNLQLGIADLSHGLYDDALTHYNDALTLFPGYWLVEEHIAEIDVIQGRLLLAKTKYRDLVGRTDSPLLRIALAEVLQTLSAEKVSDEATTLIRDAKDQLDDMVNQIPESMAGHTLEVSLQLDESEDALALAKHNHEIRPNGSSSVLLAQAYTLVGDIDKAQELLSNVLASPYRSPDLFATASVVFKESGQTELAERYAESAVALKHDAMADAEWLVK